MKQFLLTFIVAILGFSAFSQITVTAIPTACNGTSNLYNLQGTITGTMPTMGQIKVSVEGEGFTVYELPFTSPFNYTITGLNSDARSKTVDVTFTNGLATIANTYSADYFAPAACISTTCVGTNPGEETFSFAIPLQTTDISDLALTLPKFNTMSGARTLKKVLITVNSTLLANALVENSSINPVVIDEFKETSIGKIRRGGIDFISSPYQEYLYSSVPLTAAIVLNGQHGDYPGDISSSTILGMAALTPSPIAGLETFTDPRTSPNWVTTLTGNSADADDMAYLPLIFLYSTTNTIFTSSLGDYSGIGDLGLTYSTLSNYTYTGGGGNLNIVLRTSVAGNVSVTYYYCESVVTPIKLLSFTANNAENNDVKTNWVLGEQINVNHYEIEQSMNGTTFNTVGSIAAGNNLNYSFNYLNAKSGLNYFRLKTVDNNGATSYSYIVKVDVPEFNKSIVSVYPNPTTSVVNINFGSSALSKGATIKLYTTDGRIVKQQKLNAFSSTATLDVISLPAGKYFIRIETGNEVINKQLEILR